MAGIGEALHLDVALHHRLPVLEGIGRLILTGDRLSAGGVDIAPAAPVLHGGIPAAELLDLLVPGRDRQPAGLVDIAAVGLGGVYVIGPHRAQAVVEVPQQGHAFGKFTQPGGVDVIQAVYAAVLPDLEHAVPQVGGGPSQRSHGGPGDLDGQAGGRGVAGRRGGSRRRGRDRRQAQAQGQRQDAFFHGGSSFCSFFSSISHGGRRCTMPEAQRPRFFAPCPGRPRRREGPGRGACRAGGHRLTGEEDGGCGASPPQNMTKKVGKMGDRSCFPSLRPPLCGIRPDPSGRPGRHFFRFAKLEGPILGALLKSYI